MVSSTVRFVSLCSLALSTLAFTPCPLLGSPYPPFTLNASDPTIAGALQKLTQEFDQLVKEDTGPNGRISPNTTFSIALFSSNTGDAESEPAFWQYHYTSPAHRVTSDVSHNVTQDSIYRIGGLTEIFTVWSLLLAGGDQILNDPVTKHIPELSNFVKKQNLFNSVQWDGVTVGQLTSHMSGIARDYCSIDLASQESAPKAGLPPQFTSQLPCCKDSSMCNADEILQDLANRSPVAAAGSTPSYSNMAFQLLGYILEKHTGEPFDKIVQKHISIPLGMNETTVFAPENSLKGVIPVNKEASGWSTRRPENEASTSMFSSLRDLAIAGKAILNSTLLSSVQTRRWLKPVSHTSNPVNSVGSPWVIYSGGKYPNTSMVDVYSVLSNEGYDDGLYSSYFGLVPDYGIGYAILSADIQAPADLNAQADYTQAVLTGAMKTALEQAAKNFAGAYLASGNLNSSITVTYDSLPGLYIEGFTSNGTDFRQTLAELTGITKASNLSIRLYPTQLIEKNDSSSKQAFRGVLQDKTELADAGTATCVSWMDLDKFQYNGHGLDEFIFSLDSKGKALSVEMPALEVTLVRK
ncbi:Beta-lactamase-like protein [Penicillium lagena]|uniref:Beta-lactamase-like protein n=1 Tax=Penicillium lagena TaxID=94218 RepID=UPI002540C4E1|nr:Beta-lactamase-like protein [Penicillium lagena]KAJ5610828.1 Beta-lactamase-like protein [Penicillium lagena]